jgi:alpha-mannosidase
VELRGATRVELPVRVPLDHRPGSWWALVRLGFAGQLHYTKPIEIEVVA